MCQFCHEPLHAPQLRLRHGGSAHLRCCGLQTHRRRHLIAAHQLVAVMLAILIIAACFGIIAGAAIAVVGLILHERLHPAFWRM